VGYLDPDGFFRDSDDDIIGRSLPGGGILIDPDALPGYRSGIAAQTAPSAVASAQTSTDSENEPQLCPDPSTDHAGARPKDMAYQQYVSMLVNGRAHGPGLAMALLNPVSGSYVYFDDCRLSDGTMIDAKGTGYADMLLYDSTGYPWKGIQEGFLAQADRQIQAAGSRPIEWHFAEQSVANSVGQFFAGRGIRITVIWTPLP
jgi:hypothetical protein